jgi:hypothetical protein
MTTCATPAAKPPRDWRYETVTTLETDTRGPTSGAVFPTGSPVSKTMFVQDQGREIALGVPSAPALFLDISWKAYNHAMLIHPFREGNTGEHGRDPSIGTYDYLEQIMAAIVFAYTAIEGYANEEIPESYEHTYERKSGLLVVQQKRTIERRVELSEKLTRILPAVKKVPSPKGTVIWDRCVILQRLRDRIVHLKSADRAHSHGSDLYPDSLWKDLLAPTQPHYPLIARNMIGHFQDISRTHWLKYCPIE